jgi:hypothetical protein
VLSTWWKAFVRQAIRQNGASPDEADSYVHVATSWSLSILWPYIIRVNSWRRIKSRDGENGSNIMEGKIDRPGRVSVPPVPHFKSVGILAFARMGHTSENLISVRDNI